MTFDGVWLSFLGGHTQEYNTTSKAPKTSFSLRAHKPGQKRAEERECTIVNVYILCKLCGPDDSDYEELSAIIHHSVNASNTQMSNLPQRGLAKCGAAALVTN